MQKVTLSDLKKGKKITNSDWYVWKEKASIIYFIIFEFLKFSAIFSFIVIAWIVFVNFNIFYYEFKERFLSYEIHAQDINFTSAWDFSWRSDNSSISSTTNTWSNTSSQNDEIDYSHRRISYDNLLKEKLWDLSVDIDSSKNEKNLDNYLKLKLSSYEFDFNLLPPDSRLIIPSIWVDAPIVDVPYVNPSRMADADFDEELYDWVVKYPFTPSPWKEWNMMLFGHTSYYRWRNNPYWEVFARMPRLSDWDIVQVIWNWNLYEYEIFTKDIMWPREVWDYYEEHKEWWNFLTLMWCYPIGSDAQRILVVAEEIDDADESDFSELSYKN